MQILFPRQYLRLYDVIQGRLDKLAFLCRELRDWLMFFAFAGSKTEDEMSHLTDNNPIILEAYAEMQRFYANPETHDKARERRRFIKDFHIITNASKNEGKAEGKAETIMIFLNAKFDDVPEDVQNYLYSLHDVEQLDGLAAFAFKCHSLEEFASHLH